MLPAIVLLSIQAAALYVPNTFSVIILLPLTTEVFILLPLTTLTVPV